MSSRMKSIGCFFLLVRKEKPELLGAHKTRQLLFSFSLFPSGEKKSDFRRLAFSGIVSD